MSRHGFIDRAQDEGSPSSLATEKVDTSKEFREDRFGLSQPRITEEEERVSIDDVNILDGVGEGQRPSPYRLRWMLWPKETSPPEDSQQQPGMLLDVLDKTIGLADKALEAFEHQMLSRRFDTRSFVVFLPETKPENPFLRRLGSKYNVSRSMQTTPSAQADVAARDATLLKLDNKHPLKKKKCKSSRSKRNKQTTDEAFDDVARFAERLRNSPLWEYPMQALLALMVVFASLYQAAVVVKQATFQQWHAIDSRHLNGRQCVMNLFVHKHPYYEFNPDAKFAKDSITSSMSLPDTYRTLGQVEVAERFIACVADTFRTRLGVEQHLVFAGTRDGGHLAQEANLHWPPRGKYRTQTHIFAADESNGDSLAYNAIQSLEDRFADSNEYIHLYDFKGRYVLDQTKEQKTEENNDDEIDEENEEEYFEAMINRTTLEEGDFMDVLFDADPLVPPVIPYFHVDGTSFDQQLDILDQARALLEEKIIATVAVEHSPKLDVRELIDFFDSVEYKTFLLGLRQLSRIDNLCPEILDNVLEHPSLVPHEAWLFGNDAPRSPPFFVAMPKGRHQREEATIQHMYDLFSGFGGGGQVKTANDRKAPSKQRKKTHQQT